MTFFQNTPRDYSLTIPLLVTLILIFSTDYCLLYILVTIKVEIVTKRDFKIKMGIVTDLFEVEVK